jgi:hypothetical protein
MRWVEAGADSEIGLWWIADDIRQLRPDASELRLAKEFAAERSGGILSR